MRKKFGFLVLVCSLSTALSSASAFAGCGSIACNSDGSWCTGAAGYDSEGDAEYSAVSYCNSQWNGGCYVEQSECNMCIYTG